MRVRSVGNDSGMVLVTVVMIILVMSLLLTAILSQNLSQVSVGQSHVDEIKAQELALGAFWKAQADMTNNPGDPAVNSPENLDGKNFTVAVAARPAASPYTQAAAQYSATVTY